MPSWVRLTICLALGLVVLPATYAQTHPNGRPSLLSQVVPHPTGQNGYEDYLRAADLCRDDYAGLILSWSPTQFADMQSQPLSEDAEARAEQQRRREIARELSTLNYLGVQRLVLRRYRQALQHIRNGNQKPCFDPRTSLTPSTPFPELSYMKSVVRLLGEAAYAEFADGHSGEGTQILLDLLTFSKRVQTSTLISSLVSIAMNSMVLAQLNRDLPYLSASDAEKITRYADQWIDAPGNFEGVLRGEIAFYSSSFDLVSKMKSNKDLADLAETGLGSWGSFSAAQREISIRIAKGLVNDYVGRTASLFRQPESTWAEPISTPADELTGNPVSPEETGVALTALVLTHTDQWRVSILRSRAQVRLLGLHARVIAYRWAHNELPRQLSDAVPADRLKDPLAKDQFVYELKGTSYRLYSKGSKQTGEVELKYTRSTSSGDSDDSPPVLAP